MSITTINQASLAVEFGIEFNEQQVAAIAKAVEWYRGWQDGKHVRQIFFLAGFAGTGKTTVAKAISQLCAGEDWTRFVAPTGKAASRLRAKGCFGAKTLHQFIYNVRGEDEDGAPIFVAKGSIDDKPRLVVLDEASMVGEYDVERLKSHRIPILALGDTGQVEPVMGKAYFVEGTEDVLLTQIERNAGNIVRASMFVRQNKALPLREYDDVFVRQGKAPDEVLANFVNEDGVMLCSYNNTRKRLNNAARRILGFSGNLPQIGEKIVCLFNQHGYNVMNGEQGVVIGYREIDPDSLDPDEPDELMLVEFKSLTDGVVRLAKFNPACFEPDADSGLMRQVGAWDFGYGLTIHKSQGSEWPNVLVFEERMGNYAKMNYTAYTRAQTLLGIYRA